MEKGIAKMHLAAVGAIEPLCELADCPGPVSSPALAGHPWTFLVHPIPIDKNVTL